MIEDRFCGALGANPPTTGWLLWVVKPTLVGEGGQVCAYCVVRVRV